MINRYTDITPARFSPLSLQEVMLVPAMKRQKHDALDAQMEAIRTGLAKVDPLDVHYEEAKRLKSDIESKLDTQAAQLAKQGINAPGVIPSVINLNREYNNLISPTGRIGQINQAKVAFAQAKKDFFDKSPKEFSLADKERAWQSHVAKYTGFEDATDPTKSKITNITDLAAPGYKDVADTFKQLAPNVGENTWTQLKNIGAHLANIDGVLVLQSADGKTINTNNHAGLKHLMTELNREFLTPGQVGYESQKFRQLSPEQTQSQIANLINMSMSSKQLKDLNQHNQIVFNPYATANQQTTTSVEGISDPSNAITIGGVTENIDFNKIGTTKGSGNLGSQYGTSAAGVLPGSGSNRTGVPSNYTYKDVLPEGLMRTRYERIFDRLKSENKINKNANINDPKIAQQIGKIMNTYDAVTVMPKIVRPDVNTAPYQFISQFEKKEGDKRTDLLQKDVAGGVRKIVIPKQEGFLWDTDAKVIDKNEFNKQGYKLESDGYISPMNFMNNKFGNTLQQVAPHRALIKDKDGNTLGVAYVERSEEERKTPEFKASTLINMSYRNALVEPNQYISINTNKHASPALYGTKVAALTRHPETGQQLPEPIWSIKKPNGEVIYTDDKGYMDYIYTNYK